MLHSSYMLWQLNVRKDRSSRHEVRQCARKLFLVSLSTFTCYINTPGQSLSNMHKNMSASLSLNPPSEFKGWF